MMNIATKRFAPLIGILALLVLVALAGSTLSSAKRPPAIGPASASIELPESAPHPTATTSSDVPPAPEAPPEPAGVPPAEQPQPPAPQQVPAPQVPPAQQQLQQQVPAAPVPEVIVPQQPLVYDDFDDDVGNFDFDD